MKKFIFILAFMFVITSIATAQTAIFAAIPASQTMMTVNQDYVLTNTTVSWFKFTAKKDMSTLQDFSTHIDHLAGTHTNVAVKLFGQKFSTSSWIQIGSTINWKKSTSDTTIIIENTVYNQYRFYKAEFTGTGTGTETIDQMIFKQWK